MRVFFSNLGCKLNQAELEGYAREFTAVGHTVVESLEQADLHVVNTCTVTHGAARDSRKLARRGRRVNPTVRTVLTGCYVAAEPETAADLTGVDLVVPNGQKHDLLNRIHDAFPDALPSREHAVPVPYVPLQFGNARALVKIEDGCNMKCSFCIIPSTRGRQRSRSVADIVHEVHSLAEGGFAEIVLTGVQISSYRAAGLGLYELVLRLLETTGVARLRLTSIAPWQFDLRLLDLLETGRICRHFHLSLQSGCAVTLDRMRRPYSPEQFNGLVEAVRATDPQTAITTDVIVGFPGETDAQFERSLEFCRTIGFSRLHAFPFSPRPGTEAATLDDPVPLPAVKERMQRMLDVARESERSFQEENLGSRGRVLWETHRDERSTGTTDNYLRVSAFGHRPLRSLEEVWLSHAEGPHIEAEMIEETGASALALPQYFAPNARAADATAVPTPGDLPR